ncbi:MAG: protein BatD [Gemmatimonadetes bacterium]|nr:protein BatD [Gemmatimonadota bacterium]
MVVPIVRGMAPRVLLAALPLLPPALAFEVAVPAAAGQEPSVTAALNADTVTLGVPFDYTITVRGAGGVGPVPRLQLPFLGVQGWSSRSSLRSGPGGTETVYQVSYRAVATQLGDFEIPSQEITVGEAVFSTNPVSLTVVADPRNGSGTDGSPPGADGGTAAPPGSNESIFVTATLSKDEIYEGEPVLVEYTLWTELPVSGLTVSERPDPTGFWVEDLSEQGELDVNQRTLNGRSYATAVVRRLALIPSGSGTRTIEPLVLEASVREGGGFFLGTRLREVTLRSEELVVDVDRHPDGAPSSFSGLVGEGWTLEASLDRDSLEANEAVTLTVVVRGGGHIEQLPPPEIDLPADIELFPPEESGSVAEAWPGLRGEKEYRFVMIPRAPGMRAIPSIEVSYLDESTGAYETARTAPISFLVTGEDAAGVLGGMRDGIAEVREDIRFIRLDAGSFTRRGENAFGSAWFWLLFVTPLGAVAVASMVGKRRARLEGDVAYARDRGAGAAARRRLKAARALLGEGKPFYAETDRALRELAANRLDLAEAGLRTEEISAVLAEAGVSEETCSRVGETLDRCDRERFAPSGADHAREKLFLDEVSALMSALDRELRR